MTSKGIEVKKKSQSNSPKAMPGDPSPFPICDEWSGYTDCYSLVVEKDTKQIHTEGLNTN